MGVKKVLIFWCFTLYFIGPSVNILFSQNAYIEYKNKPIGDVRFNGVFSHISEKTVSVPYSSYFELMFDGKSIVRINTGDVGKKNFVSVTYAVKIEGSKLLTRVFPFGSEFIDEMDWEVFGEYSFDKKGNLIIIYEDGNKVIYEKQK